MRESWISLDCEVKQLIYFLLLHIMMENQFNKKCKYCNQIQPNIFSAFKKSTLKITCYFIFLEVFSKLHILHSLSILLSFSLLFLFFFWSTIRRKKYLQALTSWSWSLLKEIFFRDLLIKELEQKSNERNINKRIKLSFESKMHFIQPVLNFL